MNLESDVRRLLDLEAIRDLPRQYAHRVWSGNLHGAAELFTVDGVMDMGDGQPIRGRAALQQAYGALSGKSVLQPFVHNHVIELDGAQAKGVCYLDLRAVIDGRGMVGAGHYEDTYAIEDDRWKFSSRRLCMSYLVPAGEDWAGRPAAGTPPLQSR